jgi:hypothetical protein
VAMKALLLDGSAIALMGILISGCTGQSASPAGAQAVAPYEGTAPTAPPAALGGEPLGASAVIYPWEWDWRTERR